MISTSEAGGGVLGDHRSPPSQVSLLLGAVSPSPKNPSSSLPQLSQLELVFFMCGSNPALISLILLQCFIRGMEFKFQIYTCLEFVLINVLLVR